jgi:hypothetical protein
MMTRDTAPLMEKRRKQEHGASVSDLPLVTPLSFSRLGKDKLTDFQYDRSVF